MRGHGITHPRGLQPRGATLKLFISILPPALNCEDKDPVAFGPKNNSDISFPDAEDIAAPFQLFMIQMLQTAGGDPLEDLFYFSSLFPTQFLKSLIEAVHRLDPSKQFAELDPAFLYFSKINGFLPCAFINNARRRHGKDGSGAANNNKRRALPDLRDVVLGIFSEFFKTDNVVCILFCDRLHMGKVYPRLNLAST